MTLPLGFLTPHPPGELLGAEGKDRRAAAWLPSFSLALPSGACGSLVLGGGNGDHIVEGV